jgi:hypothetical protein
MDGPYSSQGDIRNTYTILVGKPEGKDHCRDLGVGGIVLKLIKK